MNLTFSNFMLQNFTILYIKMGFPRLDPSKKAELILSLIHCLNGKPQTQQDGYVVSIQTLVCILFRSLYILLVSPFVTVFHVLNNFQADPVNSTSITICNLSIRCEQEASDF